MHTVFAGLPACFRISTQQTWGSSGSRANGGPTAARFSNMNPDGDYFPSTHWSLVKVLQSGDDAESARAMEALCQR